jgi:hypothetical protein
LFTSRHTEDCNADCFEHELAAQRADSFVCYPLKKAGVRIVEEDWTLATTDVYDEVWYSTCYVFEPLREFTGLPTTVRSSPPPPLPSHALRHYLDTSRSQH